MLILKQRGLRYVVLSNHSVRQQYYYIYMYIVVLGNAIFIDCLRSVKRYHSNWKESLKDNIINEYPGDLKSFNFVWFLPEFKRKVRKTGKR